MFFSPVFALQHLLHASFAPLKLLSFYIYKKDPLYILKRNYIYIYIYIESKKPIQKQIVET